MMRSWYGSLKNMFLLIILLLPSACTQHCIPKVNYKKTTILTIKGIPINLAYNSRLNELYFTLMHINNHDSQKEEGKMYQYILRNNTPIKVENIHGQATAVDTEDGTVYIATDDGLYYLNTDDEAVFLSNKEEDFIHLFKTNKTKELYAITFPDNEVVVLDVDKKEKRKVTNIPKATMLAIDNQENIYYESESIVKMLLNGFQSPILIPGIEKDAARALARDGNGNVVLAANDGLYTLRPRNVIPTKITSFNFIPSGLTYGNNNFYVSTNGIIYRYSLDSCNMPTKQMSILNDV